MKKLFLLSVVFLMFNSSYSQVSNAELVQHQLDAYNAGDIDKFVEVFHDDVSVWKLDGDSAIISGIEDFTQSYGNLFEQSPDLYCNVVNRTIVNDKVLDYEIVTGRKGSTQTLHLVMIYEFKEGKIWKCTSVR